MKRVNVRKAQYVVRIFRLVRKNRGWIRACLPPPRSLADRRKSLRGRQVQKETKYSGKTPCFEDTTALQARSGAGRRHRGEVSRLISPASELRLVRKCSKSRSVASKVTSTFRESKPTAASEPGIKRKKFSAAASRCPGWNEYRPAWN